MAKNINKAKFNDSTKLKLEIFSECFREWFPVSLYAPTVTRTYIFDFFAGSGLDTEGTLGSPLLLLKEAMGENQKYCSKAQKPITFIFNENKPRKHKELNHNIYSYIKDCTENHCCHTCKFNAEIANHDFQTAFQNTAVQNILTNNSYSKFILLDQYGFKEIDDEIFQNLISYPKTDFIFFISSSFIRRFSEHPNIKSYINTERIRFDETKPKDCHRIIADYYRQLIPPDKEYYLHHFTIKKGPNYYGLILGSNHTLGMEKFLKVCWGKDPNAGESNCNIHNDFEEGTLFFDPDKSNKRDATRKLLTDRILSGQITNNIDGLKFTMTKGCQPKLFTEVVKKLEKDKKIERTGELKYSSTNIHKAPKYNIKVITQ